MTSLEEVKKNNDLMKEILDLLPKFSFFYRLTEDEKQILITDTYMKIYQKIQDKYIPDNPKAREGYIVLVIKNQIYRAFERRKTVQGKGHLSRIDYDVNDLDWLLIYNDNNESEIKEILNQLTPRDRSIIRFLARGWFHKDLAYALNMTRNNMSIYISYLREHIQRQL